jgi:hypothetical protein
VPEAISVVYLFSRSCPSHEEGLDVLHEAARAAGRDLDVRVREVRDDAEAEALAFPGSPTYLVEGRDPFPPPADAVHRADSCRAYERPGGRVGPLPHVRDLAQALAGAAR